MSHLKSKNTFIFRKRVLASLVSLGMAAQAQAAFVRNDIDYQYFRDFAENKGKFKPGVSNIPILNKQGQSVGTMLPNLPMPDFSGVATAGYATLVDPQYITSVQHNSGYGYVTFGNRQGHHPDEHRFNYRLIDRNEYPRGQALDWDYHAPRLEKLVTEVAPVNLSSAGLKSTVYNDTARFPIFIRMGGGKQWLRNNDGTNSPNYAISNGGNYLVGGGTLKLNDTHRNNNGWLTVDSSVYDTTYGPMANYAAPGDSGSPIFAYDNHEKRWVLVAVMESYAGDKGHRNNATLIRPDFIVEKRNEDIGANINNTINNGVFEWSLKGNNSSTLSNPARRQSPYSVDLTDPALENSDNNRQRPSLNHGKSIHFSGSNGTLQLQSDISQGAGALHFDANFTVTGKNANQSWLGAGVDVSEGKTVHWKVHNPVNDRLSKIGKGTLIVDGEGKNMGSISVGDGTVILSQNAATGNNPAKQAFSSVGIVSGRPTVVLTDSNQVNPDNIYFGYKGGRLDVNGNDLFFTRIQNTDEGARIVNNSNTKEATITLSRPTNPNDTLKESDIEFSAYGQWSNGIYEYINQRHNNRTDYFLRRPNANPKYYFPTGAVSNNHWIFLSSNKQEAIRKYLALENGKRHTQTYQGYLGETDDTKTNGKLNFVYNPQNIEDRLMLSGDVNLNGNMTVQNGTVILSGTPVIYARNIQEDDDVVKEDEWINRSFKATNFNVSGNGHLVSSRNVSDIQGKLNLSDNAHATIGYIQGESPICIRSDYNGSTVCAPGNISKGVLDNMSPTRFTNDINVRDFSALTLGIPEYTGDINADRGTTVRLSSTHWKMPKNSTIGSLSGDRGAQITLNPRNTSTTPAQGDDYRTLTMQGDLSGNVQFNYLSDLANHKSDKVVVNGIATGNHILKVNNTGNEPNDVETLTLLELNHGSQNAQDVNVTLSGNNGQPVVHAGAFRYQLASNNRNHYYLHNPVKEAELEKQREDAEREKQAEAAKKLADAEKARQNAEKLAADAERAKQAAEAAKREAEEAKTRLEQINQANEAALAAARQEAQAAQQRAEASAQAEAEARRLANEAQQQRQTAEQAKAQAEQQLNEAQNQATAAQTAKETAEQQLEAARNQATAAETAKTVAERKTAEAETKLQEALAAKAAAEDAKRQAEAEKARLEQNQNADAQALAQAQQQAEAAQRRADEESAKAEAAKQEKLEAEKARDAALTQVEAAKQAEQAAQNRAEALERQRQAAEQAKQAAETAKAQAEQAKRNADTALAAAEAEKQRLQQQHTADVAAITQAQRAERDARQRAEQNEQAKIAAEQRAVEAETQRRVAETAKAVAEQQTVEAQQRAEQAKAEAEQARREAEAAKAQLDHNNGDAAAIAQAQKQAEQAKQRADEAQQRAEQAERERNEAEAALAQAQQNIAQAEQQRQQALDQAHQAQEQAQRSHEESENARQRAQQAQAKLEQNQREHAQALQTAQNHLEEAQRQAEQSRNDKVAAERLAEEAQKNLHIAEQAKTTAQQQAEQARKRAEAAEEAKTQAELRTAEAERKQREAEEAKARAEEAKRIAEQTQTSDAKALAQARQAADDAQRRAESAERQAQVAQDEKNNAQNALNAAQNALAEAKKAEKEAIERTNEQTQKLTEAETARQHAETAKLEAEKRLQAAETAKETAEMARQHAQDALDSTRQTLAETERRLAEARQNARTEADAQALKDAQDLAAAAQTQAAAAQAAAAQAEQARDEAQKAQIRAEQQRQKEEQAKEAAQRAAEEAQQAQRAAEEAKTKLEQAQTADAQALQAARTELDQTQRRAEEAQQQAEAAQTALQRESLARTQAENELNHVRDTLKHREDDLNAANRRAEEAEQQRVRAEEMARTAQQARDEAQAAQQNAEQAAAAARDAQAKAEAAQNSNAQALQAAREEARKAQEYANAQAKEAQRLQTIADQAENERQKAVTQAHEMAKLHAEEMAKRQQAEVERQKAEAALAEAERKQAEETAKRLAAEEEARKKSQTAAQQQKQANLVSKYANAALSELSAQAHVLVQSGNRIQEHLLDAGKENDGIWFETDISKTTHRSNEYRPYEQDITVTRIGADKTTSIGIGQLTTGAAISHIRSTHNYDEANGKGQSTIGSIYTKLRFDDALYLTADAGYGRAENHINIGNERTDIKRNLAHAGIGIGKVWNIAGFDVQPHAEIRYHRIGKAHYQLKEAADNSSVDVVQDAANLMAYSAGVRIGKTFDAANGVKITPSLSTSYQDASRDTNLYVNGHKLKQQFGRYWHNEASIGVSKGNWNVSVHGAYATGSETGKRKGAGLKLLYRW